MGFWFQIDPNEKVDEAVEEILGDLAEDFIDRVSAG